MRVEEFLKLFHKDDMTKDLAFEVFTRGGVFPVPSDCTADLVHSRSRAIVRFDAMHIDISQMTSACLFSILLRRLGLKEFKITRADIEGALHGVLEQDYNIERNETTFRLKDE